VLMFQTRDATADPYGLQAPTASTDGLGELPPPLPAHVVSQCPSPQTAFAASFGAIGTNPCLAVDTSFTVEAAVMSKSVSLDCAVAGIPSCRSILKRPAF
jgi:hypothetical protein